jgi:hypothetical protein
MRRLPPQSISENTRLNVSSEGMDPASWQLQEGSVAILFDARRSSDFHPVIRVGKDCAQGDGYDVYELVTILRQYPAVWQRRKMLDKQNADDFFHRSSPMKYNSAWDICTLRLQLSGLLRAIALMPMHVPIDI